MNAITRVELGQAVAPPSVTRGRYVSLHDRVKTGILAFKVAHPTSFAKMDDQEIDLWFDLHAEAIDGFLSVVVNAALKHLRLNNPNHPYGPPKPQDVHELCKRYAAAFENAVVSYMMGGTWNPPAWGADCSAPGTKDHPMPMEQVRKIARDRASWKMSRYAEGEKGAEDDFNHIRHAMFETGERDRLNAGRREALERKRQADAEQRQQAALEREERRQKRECEEQEAMRVKGEASKAFWQEWKSRPPLVMSDELKRFVSNSAN